MARPSDGKLKLGNVITDVVTNSGKAQNLRNFPLLRIMSDYCWGMACFRFDAQTTAESVSTGPTCTQPATVQSAGSDVVKTTLRRGPERVTNAMYLQVNEAHMPGNVCGEQHPRRVARPAPLSLRRCKGFTGDGRRRHRLFHQWLLSTWVFIALILPVLLCVRATADCTDSAGAERAHSPRPPRFLLQPRRCSADAPFLLRVVFVACQDVASREAVRGSWGSEEEVGPLLRARTVFAVGLPSDSATALSISAEAAEKEDILLLAVPEGYAHLPAKTAGVLEWVAGFCAEAEFLMKVDADVLPLRQRRIFQELIRRRGEEGVALAALLLEEQPVVRTPGHKNREEVAVYPHPYFPAYATGALYVLSRDVVVAASAAVAAATLKLNNEDAFLGVVLYGLGLTITQLPLRVHLDIRPQKKVLQALSKNEHSCGNQPVVLLQTFCALRAFDILHSLPPPLLNAFWRWKVQADEAQSCAEEARQQSLLFWTRMP